MVFYGGDNPEQRKAKEIIVLSPTSLLLKRYLKIIGKERHLDLVTVSKRRVPNGPDPIHNRYMYTQYMRFLEFSILINFSNFVS